MKFIDDVVPSDKGNGEFVSRALAQQCRAFYDRTSRAVTGKIRRPYSGVCYSANCTINDDDKAFQSRLLTIPFKDLRTDDSQAADDKGLYNKFLCQAELMSALLPDLALVGLYNGKLDKHAIQDWSQFLQKALCKKRDRNLNEWAKLGFIFSQLNVLFQGGQDDQEAMFDWMLVTVTKATHELTNHAGLMDQFVIGIIKCKEIIAPNLLGPNPDKMLCWHNMRTNTVPPLYGGSARYWAIRVSKVCHVIKVLTGKTFKEADIHAAAAESHHVVAQSKSRFYNTDKNPWPIKKSIVPETDVGAMVDAPLEEEELLEHTLIEQRCIFIKVSYIDEIRASLEKSGRLEVDYKSIVIDSANPTVGTYNFFNALCTEGWFGYRGLHQGTFRTFCGANNEFLCGSPTTALKIVEDVEMEVKTCNFRSIKHCFQPEILLEFFSHTAPTHEMAKAFPACYTRLPYEFRNAKDDEAPEVPMGDMWTEDPGSIINSPIRSSPGSSEFGAAASPARRNGGRPPSMRGTPPSVKSLRSALSPHSRSGAAGGSSGPSPLAPRGANPRVVDDDDAPPPKRLRRTRASPSNHARYPRPPEEVNSMQTAQQWAAYASARGLDAAGGAGTSRHRTNQFVMGEAEAEDGEAKETVCFLESVQL